VNQVQKRQELEITLRTDPDIISIFEGLYDEKTYEDLKKSIAEHGIRVKGVVANSPEELRGVIVCGNKRYSLSQELGIEFPYILEDFENREQMMEYATNDNILRRQLTVAQKIFVRKNYTEWLRKTRQENVKTTQPEKGEQGAKPLSNDNGLEKGRTNELLAEDVGSSPATVQRALFVMDNAPKAIKQQMLQGELTISGAAKKTRKIIKKKKKTEQEKLVKVSSFNSGVEWADYGINIYHGCYHNCSYCYGKLMNKTFKWTEKWTEPIKRNIDLKDLAKKLEKLDKGSFFYCSITDAYQPLDNELNWSRKVLEVLLNSKHHIIVLTKSAYVEKDLDFIKEHDNVEVGFTIINIDDEKNKKYEPNSSIPSERIRVLKRAHEIGIKTLVSIEPWIIGHTNPIEIISELKDHVDRWIIGVYNYTDTKLEDYRPYVSELLGYLIENNLNFRLKEELVRVMKSYKILSKNEYEESVKQQVGDK